MRLWRDRAGWQAQWLFWCGWYYLTSFKLPESPSIWPAESLLSADTGENASLKNPKPAAHFRCRFPSDRIGRNTP
jgi:hypothetical protein